MPPGAVTYVSLINLSRDVTIAGGKSHACAIVCDATGNDIGIVSPTESQVEAVESLFAYPMGRLKPGVSAKLLPAAEADTVRKWLRVALAAESSGLLQATVASAVEHISLRKQFGRPLGTLQALRHRMAECAVLSGGAERPDHEGCVVTREAILRGDPFSSLVFDERHTPLDGMVNCLAVM